MSGGVVLSAVVAQAKNNDKREHYEDPIADDSESGLGVVRLWR